MNIREQIARERAAVIRAATVTGTGAGLALASAVLALAAWALADARWLRAPALLPFVAWLGALALVLFGIRRGRRHAADVGATGPVARAMEAESGTREGAVRVALEVADIGALGRRAAEDTSRWLAAKGDVLAPGTRQRGLRRMLAAGAGVVVGATGLALVTGLDGWRVLQHPVAAATGVLLPALRVETPGPRIVRGQPAHVTVHARGRRTVLVRRRATGGAWREEDLAVTDGRAEFTVSAIDADLALVATDGRATSDTAHIAVVDRPFVGDVLIRAEYPAYLRRSGEALPSGEPDRKSVV